MLLGALTMIAGGIIGIALTRLTGSINIPRRSVRRSGRNSTIVLSETLKPYKLPLDWVGSLIGVGLIMVGLYLIFASVS